MKRLDEVTKILYDGGVDIRQIIALVQAVDLAAHAGPGSGVSASSLEILKRWEGEDQVD